MGLKPRARSTAFGTMKNTVKLLNAGNLTRSQGLLVTELGYECQRKLSLGVRG